MAKTRSAVAYRVRFVHDEDAGFEECNGESRPLTAEEYADNTYMEDGKPVPYAEYLRYYGNPDRHIYLQSEVQKKCPCCGHWEYEAGTVHIDFMDDNPELSYADTWYTPEQAETLPGYLREIALQDLEQAGYRLPRRIHCHAKGCKYWHSTRDPKYAPTVDERYCAQHQPGKGAK